VRMVVNRRIASNIEWAGGLVKGCKKMRVDRRSEGCEAGRGQWGHGNRKRKLNDTQSARRKENKDREHKDIEKNREWTTLRTQ
jgi:hypothetical protein